MLKPDLSNLSEFDTLMDDHGGIDLLILAIGAKGHYAQVMPGTALKTGFHVTKLIPEISETHTKKGSDSYAGATFREYGMSLGPKQVLGAKKVIVMITGVNKKELATELFSHTSFDPQFPLSIMYHPAVAKKTSVYVTKEVV